MQEEFKDFNLNHFGNLNDFFQLIDNLSKNNKTSLKEDQEDQEDINKKDLINTFSDICKSLKKSICTSDISDVLNILSKEPKEEINEPEPESEKLNNLDNKLNFDDHNLIISERNLFKKSKEIKNIVENYRVILEDYLDSIKNFDIEYKKLFSNSLAIEKLINHEEGYSDIFKLHECYMELFEYLEIYLENFKKFNFINCKIIDLIENNKIK